MTSSGSELEWGGPTGCPVFHDAVELIGRRWNGVILERLLRGPLRFRELAQHISGITDGMLSQRLKELEAAGVVERTVVIARPVEVRYALTETGQRLAPVLDAIAAWGTVWASSRSSPAPADR